MDQLAAHLASHSFRALFIETMGWDHASATADIAVDGQRFRIDVIAQKRGFHVFHVGADKYTLFNRQRLRSIQGELLKRAHEHIVIYSCDDPRKQVWQWAVRQPDGRRLRHREHPFFSATPPEPLVGRLHNLCFSLQEEERVTLVDALDRVRSALDTEADLNLFVNRPWYAEQGDRLAMTMREGGTPAFHRFVSFHLPYARWGAKQWHRYFHGVEEEDREQIAAIGLLEAARRFDPSRGHQFSTYAYHWVRQACQRHGQDYARLIRVPTHVIRQCASVRSRLHRLSNRGGDDAVIELLRDLWDRLPRVAEYWRRYCIATSVQSLSDPQASADARRVADSVEDPSAAAHRVEASIAVESVIDQLPPQDARLIRMRYGLGGEPHTLEAIAQAVRLTRERVRQRLESIEERLRPPMATKLGLPLPPARTSVGDGETKVDKDSRRTNDAEERQLLAAIRDYPAGVGAVQLACRCAMSRSARKAALRSLVKDGRIEQRGVGRNAVYRAVTSSIKPTSTSAQRGHSENAD